jgi:O-antigen ligase
MALYLYFIFNISYFLHLTARFPALGAIRFDFLLMALTSIAIFFSPGNRFEIKKSKPTMIFIYFILYVILEIPLVGYPGSVINKGLQVYAKVAAFFFFTIYTVNTEKKLKQLLFIFFTCQTVRIFEPLYLHMTTGYWGDAAFSHVNGGMVELNRLSSGPYDVYNATQFGWLIVSIFVFYYYLLIKSGIKGKLLFLMVGPPAVYTFLLTGARSGLLCLFLVLMQIMYFQKKKSIGLIIGILMIVPFIMFAAIQLSPDMKTRYLSLVEKDVAGSDTASGRFTGLKKNFSTIWDNPIFGYGLGTTVEVNFHKLGSIQPSHNMYIEILQENGIIGLYIFLWFIISMIKQLLQRREKLIEIKEEYWILNLITALIVWMNMHLFYVLSCFSLNGWEWYFFGGLAIVCIKLADIRISEKNNLILKNAL